MNIAIWQPIVLQVFFFALLIIEFIIPSAGILTTLSILTLVGSWVLISKIDISSLFSIVLIADIILIPIVLAVGFRLMRKSPLAHQTTLDAQAGYSTSLDLDISFIGRKATTTSMLKPYGKVELDGKVFDAVSEGDYLEPNTTVQILSVQRNTLTVTTNLSKENAHV